MQELIEESIKLIRLYDNIVIKHSNNIVLEYISRILPLIYPPISQQSAVREAPAHCAQPGRRRSDRDRTDDPGGSGQVYY